jgi:hypothetical protein
VHIGRQSRQCLRDSYAAGAVSLSKKYAPAVTLSALARVEKYCAFLTCIMDVECSILMPIVRSLFGPPSRHLPVTLKESAMIFEYSLAALVIGELLLIYALLPPSGPVSGCDE